MSKIRWGILSTAKIAREKVIPAMQAGQNCDVIAIASRQKDRAEALASAAGIPKVYGSYEELLADPSIEAVYIPLPNHMHVEWAIKSLEAGKHVLCEKPIALSSDDAKRLLRAANDFPGLKLMEAFMYRFHPQWIEARNVVASGQLGEVRSIQSFFSYFNADPGNIRNQVDAGGGAMMDIGCYCISISRFIFGREPQRVMGCIEIDPVLRTDRLASGILDFGNAMADFTCSTQLAPYQRVSIVGTEGRFEIEIPFNAPTDKPTRAWYHTASGTEEKNYSTANQYTLQCDAFSQSILNNTPVPTPPLDAVNNMRVIEAIIASAAKGEWVLL